MRLFVLDLDGSVASQSWFIERAERRTAEYVDLRDLAPRLRILARRRTIRALSSRIPPRRADGGPEIFFYGSGDFHHVAAVLAARITEPLSILHLDNHPDWVLFPPTYNCGSWVNRALANPYVRRIVTMGPASGDLIWPEFKSANLKAIERGRLEVYPWRAEPSRVMRRYGPSPSWSARPGSLSWSVLDEGSWLTRLADVMARLPTEAVWLTIDKDVLGPMDAVTNWEQAHVPLGLITGTIERLAASKRIVGIDVCGDYSPRIFNDPFRRVLAHLDSPELRTPTKEDLVINDTTNRILMNTFERVFGGGVGNA